MPDLFSLYDLASYMQQDLDTATATRARVRATQYLRLELGVEFDDEVARTVVERVPATRTYLRLPTPLASVESVTVDEQVLDPGSDYEVTRYGVAAPRGFGQYATTDVVTLEVACTAGFAEIPAELADWGMHLAALAYGRGPQGGATQTSIAADGVSESTQYASSGAGEVDTDPVFLPERVLKGLRHRYGSGRPRAGTVRIGAG